MTDFMEKLLPLLDDPNVSEETKEAVRELIRKQLDLQEDLLKGLRKLLG